MAAARDLLVVSEIGGAAGAIVLAGGVDADGVAEERMIVRERARVERRQALDLGSGRRARIEKEQGIPADHGLGERSWQREEHPMPGTDCKTGVHAVPHRPGRHDVERGELVEPSGMIEREPIGNAPAAVVPGETKVHVAERLHQLDHRVRHGALGVGRVLASDAGAPDQP